MADYTATGSGSILLGGCSDFVVYANIVTKYSVGSTVYIKAQAERGNLEKVCIKEINFVIPTDSYTGFPIVTNYTDTFNELWLESELCWEAEAVSLAIAYFDRWGKDYSEAVMKCLR